MCYGGSLTIAFQGEQHAHLHALDLLYGEQRDLTSFLSIREDSGVGICLPCTP